MAGTNDSETVPYGTNGDIASPALESRAGDFGLEAVNATTPHGVVQGQLRPHKDGILHRVPVATS
jgi:hypothetical protein